MADAGSADGIRFCLASERPPNEPIFDGEKSRDGGAAIVTFNFYTFWFMTTIFH